MQDQLAKLSSFESRDRRAALAELVAAGLPSVEETKQVNMHLHTFFSFNGEGWSPARLVWEACLQGLYGMAICDFDVLQGLEEVFFAADLLGIRAAAGFESRTFFREYAQAEINSPGEPGVFYFMGMGFVTPPPLGSRAAAVLADMLDRSHSRNRALIARVNEALEEVTLDYEKDVLPLTPAGNATERHIVRAYHEKAIQEFRGDTDTAAAFWASKLGLGLKEACDAIVDTNGFTDLLRSKLMKQGGLGYRRPDEHTFPPLDSVIAMIRECRAIPMSTWLDGTREGEQQPDAQLDCLLEKGVEAVNIIPDRNWNIADPEAKAEKVAAFDRYVAAAKKRSLPINIGTECNKPGQRFVDDFTAPEMARHQQVFLKGAQVMIGHTRLLRWADVSYIDEAMKNEFPGREARNAFFAGVGALPGPDEATRDDLATMTHAAAYTYLADCSRAQTWL